MKLQEQISLIVPKDVLAFKDFYLAFNRFDYSGADRFKASVLNGGFQVVTPIIESVEEFSTVVSVISDECGIYRYDKSCYGILHYVDDEKKQFNLCIVAQILEGTWGEPFDDIFVEQLPLIRALLQAQAPSLLPKFMIEIEKLYPPLS